MNQRDVVARSLNDVPKNEDEICLGADNPALEDLESAVLRQKKAVLDVCSVDQMWLM
jgi:hypothetical protein